MSEGRIASLNERKRMLALRCSGLTATIEKDGRSPSADELKQHADWCAEIDSINAQLKQVAGDDELRQQVDRLTGGAGSASARRSGGSSVGALFASATGDFFKSGRHRTGTWRTDAVEVPYASLFQPQLQATTLTEGSGSGGALVVPDSRPGIIPVATRPIVVMDLVMPGTMTSNAVTYMQETTFTNAAAPVAEGSAKPESALVFAATTESASKIAHWLPVSDELLEDVPAIQAYIDGRLRVGVQLAEDDQLLNGNGTPPNFRGILNRSGLAATVTQGAGESVADAVLRQIAAITTTAMVAPTGIVMNAADWTSQMILKDSTGQYIGASPFETPVQPTLWGLPVALTSAIAAKTALVGAFATMAQFFRRGGMRVEASNSHQDFFVRDLVALRCEERGALAVYRPGSFGKVQLL